MIGGRIWRSDCDKSKYESWGRAEEIRKTRAIFVNNEGGIHYILYQYEIELITL